MIRPTTKEYNSWLPELQKEVAAGKDLNILGMSIPTDTTPGHLGLPERVHEKPKTGIDLILYTGGDNRDREIALDNDQALRNRLSEIDLIFEKAVMLTNPCPGAYM